MNRCAALALAALGAFLLAFVLGAAPVLHEHLHSDAGHAQHECAITIVESGVEADNEPHRMAGREPATLFSAFPALHSVWVAALFHGAHVFEHAPPAFA